MGIPPMWWNCCKSRTHLLYSKDHIIILHIDHSKKTWKLKVLEIWWLSKGLHFLQLSSAAESFHQASMVACIEAPHICPPPRPLGTVRLVAGCRPPWTAMDVATRPPSWMVRRLFETISCVTSEVVLSWLFVDKLKSFTFCFVDMILNIERTTGES